MSDTPDLPRIWVNLDDCDMDYRPFEGGIGYVREDIAERWRRALERIIEDGPDTHEGAVKYSIACEALEHWGDE